ncbi:MAG: hypothetical protein VCD31_14100, partial [Alphaproteobacteria bacterium]
EHPPLQQDVLRRAVMNETLAESDRAPDVIAALPPAPAKPQLQAFLPHPKKPSLQAAAPDRHKHARVEINFLRPTPLKPLPLPKDGPVVALLPSSAVINRVK